MEKHITCISCPIGCYLTVAMEDGKVVSVTGNTCNRGVVYAEKECTAPVRTVTSTVRLEGSQTIHAVPVKTEGGIPKETIFDCIQAIKGIQLKAPVKTGEVILENVCGTGINVIATRTIEQ